MKWFRNILPAGRILLWLLMISGNAQAEGRLAAGGRLRVPLEYYENGKIKAQILADSASPLREGVFLARDARIEFYLEDGTLDTVIETPECKISPDKRSAFSHSPIHMEQKGLVVKGQGFEWDSAERMIYVNNRSRVEIRREFAAPMIPFPGGAPIGKSSIGNDHPATVISSTNMVFDYGQRVATFSQNVKVEDPALELSSGYLVLQFDEESNLRSLTATGNVQVVHEGQVAESDKLVYLVDSGEMVLAGRRGGTVNSGASLVRKVRLTREGAVATSWGMTYLSGAQSVEMEGDAEIFRENEALSAEHVLYRVAEGMLICRQGELTIRRMGNVVDPAQGF